MDYRCRLVSCCFYGHANAFALRVDPSGGELLASQLQPVYLHRSLGQSEPTNSVHNRAFTPTILLPIGCPRLYLRTDRPGNLGQENARGSSPTPRPTSGPFETQGRKLSLRRRRTLGMYPPPTSTVALHPRFVTVEGFDQRVATSTRTQHNISNSFL